MPDNGDAVQVLLSVVVALLVDAFFVEPIARAFLLETEYPGAPEGLIHLTYWILLVGSALGMIMGLTQLFSKMTK